MQDRQNRQLERELQQGPGRVGFAAVVPNLRLRRMQPARSVWSASSLLALSVSEGELKAGASSAHSKRFAPAVGGYAQSANRAECTHTSLNNGAQQDLSSAQKLSCAHSPNAPAQARRANGVRMSTKTRNRRCLQPACYALRKLKLQSPSVALNAFSSRS